MLAIAPERARRRSRRCARASAAPYARASAHATDDGRLRASTTRASATAPIDMPLEVLLGKPPRMTRDAPSASPSAARRSTLARRRPRARRSRRVLRPARRSPTRRSSITIGDRTVGGLVARDPMVGPWQVPVADAARHRRRLRRLRRRGDGDRRARAGRAARRRGLGAAGGRRGDHQPRVRRRSRGSSDVKLSATGWRPRATPARTRGSTTPCARSASSCAPRSASRSRSARTRCRCARRGSEHGESRSVDRAAVADRHARSRRSPTCAAR